MDDERTERDGLRYLADLAEIRALLGRYCARVDARDAGGVADGAFTADAVDDHGIYGSVFRGRHEIEAMFTRSNLTTEASGHFVADPVIEIDGDVAYGHTYVSGLTWTWDSAVAGNVRPADWVFLGVYVDRFERTPEGWLLSERRVEPLGPGRGTAAGLRPRAYAQPRSEEVQTP